MKTGKQERKISFTFTHKNIKACNKIVIKIFVISIELSK